MSALTDLFTEIANAIRGKTGGSAAISATNFASAITALPSGAVSGTKSGIATSTYFADCVGKDNIMVCIAYAGPGLSEELSCASVVGGQGYRQICGKTTADASASWDKSTGTLDVGDTSGTSSYRYVAW